MFENHVISRCQGLLAPAFSSAEEGRGNESSAEEGRGNEDEGDGVDTLCVGIISPVVGDDCAFRSSLGLLLIRGFRSLSFRLKIVPSVVPIGTEWVLYYLMVGIRASEISIPLSLLMLSE